MHKTKCEDVFPELHAAGPYGVIACDANIDSDDALKLVAPMLPFLAPGGLLIFTVKCPTKYVTQKNLEKLEMGLCDGFVTTEGAARRWSSMKVVWLLANTEHERTLLAVAEGPGNPQVHKQSPITPISEGFL